MNKIIILCAIGVSFYFSACGQKACGGKDSGKGCCKSTTSSTTATLDTTALVCKLTSEEKMKRSKLLKETIFKEYEKMNELPDGVELIYADAGKYAPLLVEFINSERTCCPFFTFNLKFEPNSDKVALTVGGSPQIKEMIKTLIN